MVDQKEGETFFAVKAHYDDMVRTNYIQYNQLILLFLFSMMTYSLIF